MVAVRNYPRILYTRHFLHPIFENVVRTVHMMLAILPKLFSISELSIVKRNYVPYYLLIVIF